MKMRTLLFLMTMVLASVPGAYGAEVRVAVAANFVPCLEELAPGFQERTGHALVLVAGSTGRLFAQIRAGAPFDIFLGADTERPWRLVDEGLASRPTIYAEGRLVFWRARGGLMPGLNLAALLADPRLEHVAMANPDLAPYGRAAARVLQGLKLPMDLDGRVVQGTSVGQAWQFAVTGNAQAAFVALSQMKGQAPGTFLVIPEECHPAIQQGAVIVEATRQPEAAAAFMDFLVGEAARPIIQEHGYQIPGEVP